MSNYFQLLGVLFYQKTFKVCLICIGTTGSRFLTDLNNLKIIVKYHQNTTIYTNSFLISSVLFENKSFKVFSYFV